MPTTITFESGVVEVPDDDAAPGAYLVTAVMLKALTGGGYATSSHEWRMQLPEGFTRWQVLQGVRIYVASAHPDMAGAIITHFDVQPNRLPRQH